MTTRFRSLVIPPSQARSTLCSVVTEGLARPVGQKRLPCCYFYDFAGSELFEQICSLPEYYVTRTEAQLLRDHAGAIVAAAGVEMSLIEFGSGSSLKTRLLIEAALQQQPHLHYAPIDISGNFLQTSCMALLSDYPALTITALTADYEDSLSALPAHDGPRLLLFLGSNIGNFCGGDAAHFLAGVAARMQARDRFLVGVDLVKDRDILLAAYNDSEGITAAFNKNLLVRINHELGGDFDLAQWEHRAIFNEAESRIEMWLHSRCDQQVTVREIERVFDFVQGEGIHTENSHKYTPASFAALCALAHLEIVQTWTDERNWFAHFLLQPR